MTEKIKSYLGIAIAVSVIVVAFSTWSYVRSYGDSIQPSSFRSFSVSGEGKVVAVPDIATFSFTVITQGGKDIAALQKQNGDKASKAIAFVKGQGVVDKDIKTEGYAIEPRYQYYSCTTNSVPMIGSPNVSTGQACPPPDIVGYTITQTTSVKIRDFSKIGIIFAGVVKEGANSVSQLSFTLDDPSSVKNEARDKAITQARAKAEMIAGSGGFTVGRLLSIDEGGASPIYYESAMKSASYGMGGGIAASAPTIEAGSQDVTVNVTLRYEIK
ncbi:MAG: SIMPL domain-containing protein [Candidatus Jorgensenbacteria bacterium]|nr:SIMPL domain-containing protein [Candidatus Jorgensenbacteria bacterium]